MKYDIFLAKNDELLIASDDFLIFDFCGSKNSQGYFDGLQGTPIFPCFRRKFHLSEDFFFAKSTTNIHHFFPP